jgi:hypothetical protein
VVDYVALLVEWRGTRVPFARTAVSCAALSDNLLGVGGSIVRQCHSWGVMSGLQCAWLNVGDEF